MLDQEDITAKTLNPSVETEPTCFPAVQPEVHRKVPDPTAAD